jgi:hypothetical protein
MQQRSYSSMPGADHSGSDDVLGLRGAGLATIPAATRLADPLGRLPSGLHAQPPPVTADSSSRASPTAIAAGDAAPPELALEQPVLDWIGSYNWDTFE